MLSSATDEKQIVNAVLSEYDVDEDTATEAVFNVMDPITNVVGTAAKERIISLVSAVVEILPIQKN